MRNVVFFTGNRAEYGLLEPVIEAVAAHPALTVHLIVSGTHLHAGFGDTRSFIQASGLAGVHEVPLDVPGADALSTPRVMAQAVAGVCDVLQDLAPDIFVVYGDRYETFAAAVAATQANIVTAHIEAGDRTEGGTLDDNVRHAITKLAHLFFPTNAEAAERVLRLGEEPWRVHAAGLPILDHVRQGRFAAPEELERFTGGPVAGPVMVFTQHPVSAESGGAGEQIETSLRALHRLTAEGWRIVLTYPNSDHGSKAIAERIEAAARADGGMHVVKSLGRHNYLGMLNLCGRVARGVCVGNSSSGLKETIAFGCPTVNIGPRQDGRLRAANVLDVPHEEEAIYAACRRAVEDTSFRAACLACDNPYGDGHTGDAIARCLAEVELGPKALRKRMTY